MVTSKRFMLNDFLAMSDLIHQLREITVPKNEHVDSVAIDLMWVELNGLLIQIGNRFKEQMIDKECLEKIIGKKIHSFEKNYDEKGVFTGVSIVPIQIPEFINVTFSVVPSGTDIEQNLDITSETTKLKE